LISTWIRQAALIAILVGSAPAKTFANGPEVLPHRTLWPDSVNSSAEFDRASRAEILVFARALAESETPSEETLKAQLEVDTIDMPAVERVRRKLWERLTQNYLIAARSCVAREAFCPTDSDPGNLRPLADALSDAGMPPRYRPWFNDAMQFHRSYRDELLRLAAAFPRLNSEVETLNDNELPGWGLPDRHFLLTFDDGPTRGPGAPKPNAEDTDRTLAMLRDHRLDAVFFVMGETFQTRLRESSVEAMKTLYSGMCVGIHGWVHKSHETWPAWQDSVAASAKVVHDTLPESYVPAFRPPYGQRPTDSGQFFQRLGIKVVLWNVDSHDWDDALTADEVEQREMSLILLWRRGFLLFHDFHPRARVVVPHLISWLAHDGVTWVDCRTINWKDRGD
jgi:peptidoglycan-N-acetylglucosamine deacetylase